MTAMYTLFYCDVHDCGCVIKGNHEYTPEGYEMAHAIDGCARECDSSDWLNMGMLSYDGVEVIVIKEVRVNYDRYGGGYEFNMYSGDITDELGNRIIMEDNTPLVK
jgi:hypothetical protein